MRRGRVGYRYWKGILGGSDGTLDPRSNATCAQVAAILMRAPTLK